MAAPQPMIRPPDVGHEPHNPVRDDRKLAADEDLDRMPDGVPHHVVGLTALFSVMLAMLVVFMFFTGSTVGRVGAACLIVFAVPALINGLGKRADRDRDHQHPSR